MPVPLVNSVKTSRQLTYRESKQRNPSEPSALLCSSDGVVLLENPRGDNRLDLDSLKRVSSSIFGTSAAQLRLFDGATGESCFFFTALQTSNVADLQKKKKKILPKSHCLCSGLHMTMAFFFETGSWLFLLDCST